MFVYTVLIDDSDSARVAAVFSLRDHAIAFANSALNSALQKENVELEEAMEDDAPDFMSGVVWSRSFERPAKTLQGLEQFYFVVVQECMLL